MFVMAVLAIAFTACSDDDKEDNAEKYKAWREYNENWLADQKGRVNNDGSLYYETCYMPTDPNAYVLKHDIETSGAGLTPLYTSTTTVNYTVRLANDSIVDKGANLVTQLNSSGLIPGWGLAIMQMHVGDSAQFVLPYNMAYGTTGTNGVKPYSNLLFNIRLVNINAYEVRP